MGNSRSQPSRRSRPMYLFYLIQRTWSGKTEQGDDKEDRDEATDRRSELSSRCSGCKSCGYQQDSLTYDSESEMAPNAEEELVAVKPWGPQPEKQERLRPPTYNAEDYANALRRWGRRPLVTSQDSHGTLPSTTSSSSGYASGCGEMTLRQFTSVSELLNKLRADLRLAFPSFVQEFSSAPADGLTLLLETLRGVQLILSSPPSGQGGPRMGTRRAALDELGCVECLAACGERCADAPRLLSKAQPGLLALAVCLTSSLNRSRVLALQLLTKVCQAPGGHLAVSEAVSTLRLRYGEGGRFRFLAGALLAPRAAIALRVAGISFLNAFLKSAPRTQTRLYIQAEACEAGLEPRVLQAWLTEVDGRSEDALTDLLHKEVQKWSHNCVDVDALQKRLARAEETCAILGNKVTQLQGQLDNYHMDKINSYNHDDRKIMKTSKPKNSEEKTVQQVLSSNAEDEGISSSERSSSPEDLGRAVRTGDSKIGSIDNDQETTIDDVIEELRIIVKDAEEEFEDRKGQGIRSHGDNSKDKRAASSKLSIGSANHDSASGIEKRFGATRVSVQNPTTYFGRSEEELSVDSAVTRKLSSSFSGRNAKSSNEGSVKIVVKCPEVEDAIVPAILYPQPPRRAPPCLSTILATREGDFLDQQVVYNSHDDDDVEEETLGDGSDSLLSASRLKYNSKNEVADVPAIPADLDAQTFYQSNKKNVAESRNSRTNAPTNSRELLDVASDKRETKTIRNFDGVMNMMNLHETDPTIKYLEVYKQFESINKSNEPATPVQRRGSKYKSEVEKRKLLRKSASQDLLGSSTSSAPSSCSRIESRIRKFETLNAFENTSLQSFVRVDETGKPINNRNAVGGSRSRMMQRSESFHHVSHAEITDPRLTRGGSDSGLLYVTDYDLEPLVARHVSHETPTIPASLLSKSLDRIDEGFDSMIDGTILQGKRCQTVRSMKEKHGKNSKARADEKAALKSSKSLLSKSTDKKSNPDKKNLKNDELYSGLHGNAKPLRSDELYDEGRNGRQWNFQNEVDGFRKVNNFVPNRNSMTITSQNGTRLESFSNDRMASKFSTNDSGVFLPSGRYDAFGLGKNRFNAGMYSGQPQPPPSQENIGVRRNSAASLVAKRGKVTDILSGLY